jgi:hypothetical protein
VVKKMPEKMTEVKMGLPSKMNMSYISIYVALKKGYYQKTQFGCQVIVCSRGSLGPKRFADRRLPNHFLFT